VLSPPVLVVDECLDKRLASELNRRGRPAKSVSALGMRSLDDPQLFQALAKLGQPYVIVTADEAMPLDWMAAIEALGVTVAVVDSRRTGTATQCADIALGGHARAGQHPDRRRAESTRRTMRTQRMRGSARQPSALLPAANGSLERALGMT
jgi:hypothetical protein